MRIISQDGCYDLPYEQVVLLADDGDIWAFTCDAKKGRIASYSTQERAVKAMEMCRKQYLTVTKVEGGYNVLNHSYVQPNLWVLPKIFQFPKDNEVDA